MSELNILDGYISRSKLAEQLGKSESTIVRWGVMQIGPPVTWIGREPYYKIDCVREWLRSREQQMPRKRVRAAAAA